jgi:1-acylglycerone phosphate reductase
VLEVVTGAVKTNGQAYFGDFKLPEQSLYKSIEDTIANRAQGIDGLLRMEIIEYATKVVNEITSRATGRFWCGNNAESVKMGTTATAVPQSDMVSFLLTSLPAIDILTGSRMLELLWELDLTH